LSVTQVETISPSAPRPWTPTWWRTEARWLSLLAPLAIFAGHMSWGAVLPKTALTLALACSLLLLAALATPGVRKDLEKLRGLRWPAILFAVTLFAILWSMTPFAPGGPHPVWKYVGVGPAASTMDKSQTLLELIKLLGLAGIFMLGCVLGASDSRARASLNVILALGAAMGFWAFLQFAGGALGPGVRRLGASFENPNTAATFFGMLLPLGLAGAISRAASGRRDLASAAPSIGASLVFAACVLATASRGGFLATAAGLVTFAVLQTFGAKAKWTPATIGLAAGIVIFAALLAVAGGGLISRLGESSWDLNGRRAIFTTHWHAFLGAPWMGYGLGTFDAVNRVLLDAETVGPMWVVRAAHNVYLTWLEQAGVVGAIPMFLAIASVLLITLRRAVARSRFKTALFALLAADIVILVHGATDFALETYSVAAFWSLLLGLQFSASQGSRR